MGTLHSEVFPLFYIIVAQSCDNIRQCQTLRVATRRKRSPGQQPTPIATEKLVTSDATAAKEITPNAHPDLGGALDGINRNSGNLMAVAEIGVIML